MPQRVCLFVKEKGVGTFFRNADKFIIFPHNIFTEGWQCKIIGKYQPGFKSELYTALIVVMMKWEVVDYAKLLRLPAHREFNDGFVHKGETGHRYISYYTASSMVSHSFGSLPKVSEKYSPLKGVKK